MGELFWNKIAGAAIAAVLAVFVLKEFAHLLYHEHAPEELAYAIEVPDGPGGPVVVEDTGPPDFGALLREASIGAGERVARKCVACHTFEKGGVDKVGPHMWDVVGRVAGSVDGFAYSSAMAEYAREWSYENLYDYLENPRGYVSGTAMAFAGLRKQEDRINLIAYLYTLSDAPRAYPDPLPAVDAVVEPAAADANATADAAVVDAVVDTVTDAADAAGDTAAQIVDAATDAAADAADETAQAVADTAEDVADAVTGGDETPTDE